MGARPLAGHAGVRDGELAASGDEVLAVATRRGGRNHPTAAAPKRRGHQRPEEGGGPTASTERRIRDARPPRSGGSRDEPRSPCQPGPRRLPQLQVGYRQGAQAATQRLFSLAVALSPLMQPCFFDSPHPEWGSCFPTSTLSSSSRFLFQHNTYHTYHTIPYHTIPYLPIPYYRATPNRTIPHRTNPYHAIP